MGLDSTLHKALKRCLLRLQEVSVGACLLLQSSYLDLAPPEELAFTVEFGAFNC